MKEVFVIDGFCCMLLCVERAGTFSVGHLLLPEGVQVESRGTPAGGAGSRSASRERVAACFLRVSRRPRQALIMDVSKMNAVGDFYAESGFLWRYNLTDDCDNWRISTMAMPPPPFMNLLELLAMSLQRTLYGLVMLRGLPRGCGR